MPGGYIITPAFAACKPSSKDFFESRSSIDINTLSVTIMHHLITS